MKQEIKFYTQRSIEGFMTLGRQDDGMHFCDFQCTEDVTMEPFKGMFHVQAMRDGNIYITEKPKRIRNTPMFRDDNSSLSLGRDNRYYFVFSLPKERLHDLPEELVRQAGEIARKMVSYLYDLKIIDRV